ncbi:MAG: substrate-binding domain-containing protein, partial [Pseudomonadota bacterium]
DVSVVGFDDIELASAVEPELTTVHVPHRRMGRAAAKAVLRLRNGGEPPSEPILFETSIVERGSLGDAPGAG